MILLISYDLNRHERPAAYAAVKRMIESSTSFSIRVLHSQWLVDTLDDPTIWHQRMAQVADRNDRWLIVPLTYPYTGWLDDEAAGWLNGRIR